MKRNRNGYRPARGGWGCRECRHAMRDVTGAHYCLDQRNANRSSSPPACSADHTCDLFAPRPNIARIRAPEPPRGSTSAGAEWADAQYNGGPEE